jgi:single-strand DNA-binding protein
MAGSLNKAVLIGNLGADPEIRPTNDGREFASFSIATSETWTDKATGDRREKTEWHRIVVFSEGLVRVIKNYVKKGTRLYIEGQLRTRKWIDEENQERYTTEIVLQNFNSTLLLLDSKSKAEEWEFKSTVENGQKTNSDKNISNKDSLESLDDSDKFNNLDDEIPF